MLLSETLSSFIAAGVVLGGIGYAVGQFISSKRHGVSDALATALNEIAANKERGDRLARDLDVLTKRFTTLEAENRVLRETLQTGIRLAPEFSAVMGEMLRVHEEKSEALIRDAIDHLAVAIRQELTK